MAKSKKLLSVILAIAIVFSALSAALVAFATSPAEVVERINAFNGTVGRGAKEEDIKEFESIAAEYKALTDSQKDELDIVATGKLFKLAWDRAYYLKGSGAETPLRGEELYLAADEMQKDYLGRTKLMEDAQNFAREFYGYSFEAAAGGRERKLTDMTYVPYWFDGSTKASVAEIAKVYEDMCAKYAALGQAKRYLPMIYDFYSCGFARDALYNVDAHIGKFFSLELAYQQAYKNAPGVDYPIAPVSPSYYDTEKYPLGKEDPQYIADKKEYDEVLKPAYNKTQKDYDSAVKEKNADYQAAAWARILELDSGLVKASYDLTNKMIAALEAYGNDKSEGNEKAVVDTYTEYGNLAATDKAFFDSVSFKYNYYDGTQKTSASILRLVKPVVGKGMAAAFVAEVNKATVPYTQDELDKVLIAWNKVFNESKSSIPADVMNKFRAIIKGVPAPDIKPVLPDWTRPNLKYPLFTSDRSLGFLVKVLDGTFGLIFKQQGYANLNDLLTKKVYTNATVASAAKALYPAFNDMLNNAGAGLATALLKIKPNQLAGLLVEDKFATAAAAFKALGGNISDWEKLDISTITNGYFGFNDGDRDGFINALAAVLRGITVPITSTLEVQFANVIEEKNGYPTGGYKPGLYDNILPVLEALGIKNLMTSEEYSAGYLGAATPGAKADAAIVPIVSAVFSLVDDISAKPVSAVVEILPKVARLFSDNILNNQLKKIHNNLPSLVGMFIKPDKLTIDPSVIMGLVNSLAGKIKVGNTTLSLKFSDPDWALLASTAKPVIVKSVSRFNAYSVGFETNKGDSFLVIFRYLFNNLTEQSNMASIKAAIKAVVKNFVFSNILGQAMSTAEGINADEALEMVHNVLDIPEIPEDPSTEVPATEDPSTEVPATEEPSTEVPATEEPSTEVPATEVPSTEVPATEDPSTEVPATEDPSTEAPVTEDPSTEVPATEEPSTEVPATEEPSTEAPVTEAPSTEVPATEEPSTEVPATEEPSMEAPAQRKHSTDVPSTQASSVDKTAVSASNAGTANTQAPANGDNLILGAFAAIAVISGAAIVITKKRK